MGQQVHFNASAQLYENRSGELAIRFANNLVFEYVGLNTEKGFVAEAKELLLQERRAKEWHLIPYRKLLYDEQDWHLISSMGFLDGNEDKPAVILEVKPEALGQQARRYLKPDMPITLQ